MVQGRNLNRVVTLIIAIGVAGFGYDQGVMGGIIDLDEFRASFHHPSHEMVGIIVALFEIGAAVGAMITGRIADTIGRIKTILAGCLILCVGAIMQAAAHELVTMNIGRVVAGVGIGFLMTTLPLLQSEVAPSHHRGKSQATHWVISIIGLALAYVMGYAMLKTKTEWNWRVPVALQMLIIIGLAAGCILMPESPRWLARKNKWVACRKVLLRITEVRDENDKAISDPQVAERMRLNKTDEAMRELKQSIEEESLEGRPRWRDMFKTDGLNIGRRTWLAMGIQAMQQLTGINAIAYYQVGIFRGVGMSIEMASLMSIANACLYLVGASIPVFLIEKVGRRPLLIVGALGQAAAMIVLGSMFMVEDSSLANWVGVTSVFVFTFIFGTAWLCIAWMYPAELFPNKYRGHGCAAATLSNFVFNAIVGLAVPKLQSIWGGWLYIAFGILNFLFAIVIWALYPETGGRSLEELTYLFGDQKLANTEMIESKRTKFPKTA